MGQPSEVDESERSNSAYSLSLQGIPNLHLPSGTLVTFHFFATQEQKRFVTTRYPIAGGENVIHFVKSYSISLNTKVANELTSADKPPAATPEDEERPSHAEPPEPFSDGFDANKLSYMLATLRCILRCLPRHLHSSSTTDIAGAFNTLVSKYQAISFDSYETDRKLIPEFSQVFLSSHNPFNRRHLAYSFFRTLLPTLDQV